MIDIAKLREIKRTNSIQKQLEEDTKLMKEAFITRTKKFEKLIDDSLLSAAESNKTCVDIKFNITSLENLKALINIISMYKNDYRCMPIHADENIENKLSYESDLSRLVLYYLFSFANTIFAYKNVEFLITLFKDNEAFKNAYKSYSKFATDFIIIRFDFSEGY
jgi:hypothetical protein